MDKVTVIAEAGVNHNGSLDLAKKMAKIAKESGADIVKFQTAKLESFITKTAPMAKYQERNTKKIEPQMEMLRNLLLSYEDFIELSYYCEDIGIKFLSSPFDLESIEFLKSIGCDMWKIPSGEITNLPYLKKISRLHQPVILSTGMSSLEEVKAAMDVLKEYGAGEVTILHCTSEYPTRYEDVNLKAMLTLKNQFDVPVGYSDHTQGIEISIAAAALGASVVEKHFTLDRNMEGPDHKASLEPGELKKMVSLIRNIELSLGDGIKKPVLVEEHNIVVARKSIVASVNIKKGEKFTEENLTVKRPGNGISPMRWFDVLGQTAIKDFVKDELIEL